MPIAPPKTVCLIVSTETYHTTANATVQSKTTQVVSLEFVCVNHRLNHKFKLNHNLTIILHGETGHDMSVVELSNTVLLQAITVSAAMGLQQQVLLAPVMGPRSVRRAMLAIQRRATNVQVFVSLAV